MVADSQTSNHALPGAGSLLMVDTDSAAAAAGVPAREPVRWDVRFTASGSEYFRIWVVNLLLIVVTLGFYLPFAKARRLRYFYANTWVDGYPLAFHGDAWRMFRGYVLMLVLFGAYAAASYMSELVALSALVLLALAWPALWRSSLLFRLRNTSWRGLRFDFEGSMAGAYSAMLPFFVPGLLSAAISAWIMHGVDLSDEQALAQAYLKTLPPLAGIALLIFALGPLAMWHIKRYQHGHYRLADQSASLDASRWSFYGKGLQLAAWGVGGLLLMAGMAQLFASMARSLPVSPLSGQVVAGIGMGVAVAAYVGLLSAAGGAWLQNLCWSRTGTQAMRFQSDLSVGPYLGLFLKNLFLVVVTLGFYRPFAVVNTCRMRLQAVHVQAQGPAGAWTNGSTRRANRAGGEMSGDFFGFDVGL